MRGKVIALCAFLLISSFGVGKVTYTTLYSFTSWEDGQNPFAGLTFDQAGNLYGVAAYASARDGVVFQLSPSGGDWEFHSLYQFDQYEYEGAFPMGGLAVDEAGNVYGTTYYDRHPGGGCGSVFQLSPSGIDYLRYFYRDGAEGCAPEATLTYSNGRLWGTTTGGGSKGQGTVFSMDASGGSFDFDSFSGTKGRGPSSAFSLWGYGTTYSGGGKGKGNIYRLEPGKGFITKYSFKVDGKAGYAPVGDLLTVYVGGVRTIYGTASAGGAGGGGAVYRLTEIEPNSDRWRIKVLHSFSSGSSGKAEGWAPMAGVTADAAGNLYGTTTRGGENDSDCGTVFKLSPGKNNTWTHTVLYSFDYYNWDGCEPNSVVLDAEGNLYGTTVYGGEEDYGSVYEITP